LPLGEGVACVSLSLVVDPKNTIRKYRFLRHTLATPFKGKNKITYFRQTGDLMSISHLDNIEKASLGSNSDWQLIVTVLDHASIDSF